RHGRSRRGHGNHDGGPRVRVVARRLRSPPNRARGAPRRRRRARRVLAGGGAVDPVILAYPRARAAQDLLERAIALLPSLPSALEQALSALSRFLSTDGRDADHLASLDAAIKQLAEAQTELSAGRAQEMLRHAAELLLGSREDAIKETVQKQDRMLRAA